MSVSYVITGVFTNHLQYKRRDVVGLDVLDLQHLLAVFLVHCSHLCQTGQHFGVQQTMVTEETTGTGQSGQCVRGLVLCCTELTESGMWYFTHCFSGSVLLQSIQLLSVSAKFSRCSSITLLCCTPGRSD